MSAPTAEQQERAKWRANERADRAEAALGARSWQALVRDFHEAMGVVIEDVPTVPARALAVLRADLVDEEARELVAELVHPNPDPALVAKEMADLVYVVLGTAVSLGIDLDPVFRAVHESNMAKATGPVRADGKRLKPEGWTPPDIDRLLREQVPA